MGINRFDAKVCLQRCCASVAAVSPAIYLQLHAEERTEDRTGPRFPGLLPVRATTQGLMHLANTPFGKSRLRAGCQACQAAPKFGSCASESTQHSSAAGCKFAETFVHLCQRTLVTQHIRQYHQHGCAGECNYNQGCQPW